MDIKRLLKSFNCIVTPGLIFFVCLFFFIDRDIILDNKMDFTDIIKFFNGKFWKCLKQALLSRL